MEKQVRDGAIIKRFYYNATPDLSAKMPEFALFVDFSYHFYFLYSE